MSAGCSDQPAVIDARIDSRVDAAQVDAVVLSQLTAEWDEYLGNTYEDGDLLGSGLNLGFAGSRVWIAGPGRLTSLQREDAAGRFVAPASLTGPGMYNLGDDLLVSAFSAFALYDDETGATVWSAVPAGTRGYLVGDGPGPNIEGFVQDPTTFTHAWIDPTGQVTLSKPLAFTGETGCRNGPLRLADGSLAILAKQLGVGATQIITYRDGAYAMAEPFGVNSRVCEYAQLPSGGFLFIDSAGGPTDHLIETDGNLNVLRRFAFSVELINAPNQDGSRDGCGLYVAGRDVLGICRHFEGNYFFDLDNPQTPPIRNRLTYSGYQGTPWHSHRSDGANIFVLYSGEDEFGARDLRLQKLPRLFN